jgi:hypothetical protein
VPFPSVCRRTLSKEQHRYSHIFQYRPDCGILTMSYKTKALLPTLNYEEKIKSERKRRFCLKPVKLIETKVAKDEDCVNIQFTRGNKTGTHIDNVEEKKIHEHFAFVTSKLRKTQKSIMWNTFIGRSFLEKNEPVNQAKDEINIDIPDTSECDINKPKTWSSDCIAHIEDTLRVFV